MNNVSTKKRNWLLYLSFLISFLILASFVYFQIQEHNYFVAEEQRKLYCKATGEFCYEIYTHVDASILPFIKIIVFFLLPIIYKSKKYIVSVLLTSFLLAIFVLDFISHFLGIIANEVYDTKSVYEMTLMIASPFDWCIFILLSILFVLQLSIITRFIINRFQAKIYLR